MGSNALVDMRAWYRERVRAARSIFLLTVAAGHGRAWTGADAWRPHVAARYSRAVHVDLTGKKALVTGGSGAMGRAICVGVAAAGAEVAFTYFSNREGAEATLAELARAGNAGAHMIRANFGDAASAAGVVAEVRGRLGRVDCLISNAASGVFRMATEVTPRHLQWTLDVNARAVLGLVQGLLHASEDTPALMGKGARIVALSSLGAVRAIPQYTALAASKAAMEAIMRHLALELGPLGIGVNIVSPGLVDTPALQHFPNREHLIAVAGSRTPMARLTTAEDVAAVVLFLCSEASAMIHGQTIHVDGGYSIVG